MSTWYIYRYSLSLSFIVYVVLLYIEFFEGEKP